MLPAQVVVGEAGIVEQVLPADQPAPALEHRLAGDLQRAPSRRRTSYRSHGATDVPRLPMRGLSTPRRSRSISMAFDIMSAVGSSAPSTCWPSPGGLPVVQRHHHADGQGHRRAEVDVGHHRADRLVGQALAVDGAGQHLAGAVEADLVAVGATLAVGRGAGEDDVGLDRPEASRSRGRWPACAAAGMLAIDDVGAGDQPAGDLGALGRGRVERERALVAVALQEGAALAAVGDRLDPAVLAALALLDPDHVGAHVGEDGAAPRRGDEPPVVEHPDAVEHLRRAPVIGPSACRGCARR